MGVPLSAAVVDAGDQLVACGDPTFPVFLYGRLRFAQQLPVLIAMAVLLMIATVTMTLIAQRLRREDPA